MRFLWVALAVLEQLLLIVTVIQLPLPLECWLYWPVPPSPGSGSESTSLVMLRGGPYALPSLPFLAPTSFSPLYFFSSFSPAPPFLLALEETSNTDKKQTKLYNESLCSQVNNYLLVDITAFMSPCHPWPNWNESSSLPLNTSLFFKRWKFSSWLLSISLFILCLSRDRILFCDPDWPRIFYVALPVLELVAIHLSQCRNYRAPANVKYFSK